MAVKYTIYKKMETIPVFVYGSLRKGLQNNHKLDSAIYKGIWKTVQKYYMIGTKSGSYPYVTTEELVDTLFKTNITGELYLVTPSLLESLDEMEGHPEQYRRILTEIVNDDKYMNAYIYILESDELKEGIQKGFTRRFESVNGGDWVAHLDYKK